MRAGRSFGFVIVLLATIPLAGACESRPAAFQRKTVLRFAQSEYAELLAREYSQLMPDVAFEIVPRSRLKSGGDAILKGDADLAIALADAAYSANVNSVREPTSGRTLRAIGVLRPAPLHLLVRSHSGINSIRDLRGRRVGAIATDFITEWVLKAYQLDHAIVRVGPFARPELAETIARNPIDAVFTENNIDALFIVNLYPAPIVADAIRAGARLIPIEGKQLIQLSLDYPFVQLMSIPASVYPGQDSRVRTIGIPVLLAVRNDLDDELVYRLTAHLIDAVTQVPLYNSSMRRANLQEASATTIPLHDSAARYYRECEVLR